MAPSPPKNSWSLGSAILIQFCTTFLSIVRVLNIVIIRIGSQTSFVCLHDHSLTPIIGITITTINLNIFSSWWWTKLGVHWIGCFLFLLHNRLRIPVRSEIASTLIRVDRLVIITRITWSSSFSTNERFWDLYSSSEELSLVLSQPNFSGDSELQPSHWKSWLDWFGHNSISVSLTR